MNPDAWLIKKGYYLVTISNLHQYNDDSKTILIDGITNPISEEDIYRKIYGQERVPIQYLMNSNMPYIENIRFIPCLWEEVFA